MGDEIALFAACLRNPDENTPRLIYADWLDEYGTTDRQAAQVEWIRLTCHKPRTPSGIRRPGERDWMEENAPRLFPKLWSRCFPRLFRLETSSIGFSLHVPGRSKSVVSSKVNLAGGRGLIWLCQVTFTRASFVAPWCAADCPLSPISFIEIPRRVFDSMGSNNCYVMHAPFKTGGLENVYSGLEGKCLDVGYPDRICYRRDLHPEPFTTARKAIDASLTRWARHTAGVPHVVMPTPPDPDPDPEPLPIGPPERL